EMFEYVKGLIKMRKEHPAFRMTSAKQIASNIEFVDNAPTGTLLYLIDGKAVGDKWKKILVCLNGSGDPAKAAPHNIWKGYIINNRFVKDIHEKNEPMMPY